MNINTRSSLSCLRTSYFITRSATGRRITSFLPATATFAFIALCSLLVAMKSVRLSKDLRQRGAWTIISLLIAFRSQHDDHAAFGRTGNEKSFGYHLID